MSFAMNIQINPNLTTVRGHRRLLRDLLREAAERHRTRILDKHFEQSAAARYGYRPRKAGYMRAKAKKWGHQLPLVWTGRLRSEAKSRSVVTATQYGARLYLKGYFPMNDDRRGELEAITSEETADMAARVERDYAIRCVQPPYARTRRPKRSP